MSTAILSKAPRMSRNTSDGGWAVDNLGLSLASARLAGALAVGADTLATGDLSFSASESRRSVAARSHEAERRSSRRKRAPPSPTGKQMLSVTANSDRMTIDANRLEGLKVDFKVADLWGAKIVSGFAQLGARRSRRTVDHGRQADGDRQRVGERSRLERKRARPRDQCARGGCSAGRRRVSSLRASPLRAAASASRSQARRP